MLLIYIGIYTLLLVAIWALFMIARIHAYKFKDFSLMIVRVTNTLGVILAILSLLGYIFIFLYGGSNTNSLDVNFDATPSSETRSFDDFDENYY